MKQGYLAFIVRGSLFLKISCRCVTYQLVTQHAAHPASGANAHGAAKLGQRVHARATPCATMMAARCMVQKTLHCIHIGEL